jgi:dTDP-glucose 4,6-dehydratase
MLTTRVKKVDCAKARRELGHKTTVTLEEGIAQTIEWMRDVYRVK